MSPETGLHWIARDVAIDPGVHASRVGDGWVMLPRALCCRNRAPCLLSCLQCIAHRCAGMRGARGENSCVCFNLLSRVRCCCPHIHRSIRARAKHDGGDREGRFTRSHRRDRDTFAAATVDAVGGCHGHRSRRDRARRAIGPARPALAPARGGSRPGDWRRGQGRSVSAHRPPGARQTARSPWENRPRAAVR